MNFRAYNQLRLLGYSPEAAALMADSHHYIEMYEEKEALDSASHAGFSPVIGLKDEFKTLVIQSEGASMKQMPYATAVTLVKQAGIAPEAAHEIATKFQDLAFESSEAALDGVKKFSEIYAHHADAAMKLLEAAHEVKVINFS